MVIINKFTAKWFRQEKSKKPFVKVLAVVMVLIMLVSVVAFAVPTISARQCSSYFTHQETIYIDITALPGWDTNDNPKIRVYSYYGNTNDDWNVENNRADSGCYNNTCFQNAINPTKISDHLYSFNIQGNEVGYVKVMRLDSGMNSCWNSTGFVYSENRSGSQNCIKITGWDNSYQWTTYSAGGGSGYHEVTAVPDAATITNNSSIFPIDATFYDYYTDNEVSYGWGNINYVNSHGDWEPYTTLNNKIAAASSGVNYPMYFGNFFDKDDGYTGAGSSNMVNFSNWVNNSARLGGTHKSIVGLTGTSLVDDDLVYAAEGGGNSSVKVPFFDKSFLQNNGVGSVVNTKFPMRKVTTNGITTYVFDSTGANDNAWFSADRETMYYGQGTSKGAKDALWYYSNPQAASGYGFFPFDSARGADKEALNFAFGMRVDIPFNLGGDEGHYGQIKGTNGSYSDQKFTFTGDDDVWVYIDGNLVLDLGGDHQKAEGSINFAGGRGRGTVSVTYGSNTLNNATRNTSFSINNYDPTVEHTLTMFYVERGMVESNLSFDFNFAPIGNELIVDKTVNTANLNNSTEFRNAVAAADTFSFNQPTANGKQSSKGTISNSTYTLKNAEYISFKDQFEVPTDMTVTESYTGSILSYDTTWKAVDLVLKGKGYSESDYTIGIGSGTASSFTYQTLDTSSDFAMTRVQLSYVNTPQVGSFSVKKEMAPDTVVSADKTFPATIYLKLKDSGSFTPYTLVDDAGNTCTGGRVDLVPGETITFSGIPIGTRVYVVEDDDPGYTPFYSHTVDDPYVVSETDTGITIVNTETPVGNIVSAAVEGCKTLDLSPYTGDLFTFKLNGVARYEGDDEKYIDTSDTELTTAQTDSTGKFSFDLTFDKVGVYRYVMSEDMSVLSGTDYATDFEDNTQKYLVVIEVSRQVNSYGPYLELEGPYYLPFTGTAPSSSDFANYKTAGSLDPLTFDNTSKTGQIRIEKANQKGQAVNGVIFGVYKVPADLETSAAYMAMTDEEKYDHIMTYDLVDEKGTGTDYGFDNGVTEITDLPIFEDGFVPGSGDTPRYQHYALIETLSDYASTVGTSNENATYNLNKTVQFFSFPMDGDDGPQYHCTYQYVNGVLKAPNTAGSGMTLFKTIGWLIAGLAVASLGGYLIFGKRSKKRKPAKHFAK